MGKKKEINRPVPERDSTSTFKLEYIYLALILLTGLSLRLIFYNQLKGTVLYSSLFSDSKLFVNLASLIVRENLWFGEVVFYMSPGYTLFLSVIYFIAGQDLDTPRILQILINSSNIYIIFLIARKMFPGKTGLIAALLSSIYSMFIFYSSLILAEVVFTFFLSLLVYNLIKAADDERITHWLTSGILLGLAALFRGSILLLFPFLIIWLIYKNRHAQIFRKTALQGFLFTAGMMIPVIPVTINNSAAEGDFVFLSSSAGINFYIGNHKHAPGIYKIPEEIDLSLDPQGENYAERVTGRDLTSAEASAFWFNKGLSFVIENPIEASELLLKKVLLFFDNAENAQSAFMDQEFYSDYTGLLKLPLPGYYFIILLGISGIVLSLRRDSRFTIMYLFIAAYILSTVTFFVIGRFRLGIVPVFIVFAGFAVVRIIEILRNKEFRKLLNPVIAVAVLIILNSITPTYSFSSYDAWLNLGNNSFEQKEYDKALEYYYKSHELKEQSSTHVLIGNTLSVKKDVAGALDAYKRALELDPYNPLAHFNLGTLFVRTGNYGKALNAFEATVSLDSTIADAYRNMAIIYYIGEKYIESLNYFEKYLYFSKDKEAKITVQKDIEELKKKIGELP